MRCKSDVDGSYGDFLHHFCIALCSHQSEKPLNVKTLKAHGSPVPKSCTALGSHLSERPFNVKNLAMGLDRFLL